MPVEARSTVSIVKWVGTQMALLFVGREGGGRDRESERAMLLATLVVCRDFRCAECGLLRVFVMLRAVHCRW